MTHPNHVLFGGKKIAAYFENVEAPVELTVRQLKLREYQHALTLLDDEIALVGFGCGLTRDKALDLRPESYDELLVALKEVNAKGFFTFAERQMARNAAALQSLPPDLLEKVLARGKPISPMPSPTVPPPAG